MLRNFGTPKQCIQARNTSFASFYILKVSKMIQNTHKYHCTPKGLEWMHLVGNYFCNFGTPKQCIQDRNTSFASFYMPKVSKMLQNTPKHHFGSNGVDWMLRNFGNPKYCIQAQNTSLASFLCRRLAKCSETLPNIILALMEYNGCFFCETIFTTSVPRNSAMRSETQVLQRFTCKRFANCSETLQNIILAVMEQNGCFCCETIFATSVPRNSAFRSETQDLQRVTCRRFAHCSETLPNIILALMEYNGCFCCETIFATSVP